MKLLVVSDIHIHNYYAYSTLDPESGVPSRLTDYLRLAADLALLAKKVSADLIVIAGDISNSPVVRPMVNCVVRSFFETLCGVGLPVVVIPGQHDLDTKATDYSEVHSVLTSLVPRSKNLHYFTEAQLSDGIIPGLKFYVRPWLPGDIDHDALKPADIFIGHGLVRGAVNSEGHPFQGSQAFSTARLLDNYRLSIVGDIHKRQVFEKDGRIVLLPGCPIQASWKDEPKCGASVCEIGKSGAVSVKFIPFTNFANGKMYHQFLYSTEIPADAPANIHYRATPADISDRKVDDDMTASIPKAVDLLKTAQEIAVKAWERAEDAPRIRTILKKTYEKSVFQARNPVAPNQSVRWLEVTNCLTIKHHRIELAEMEGDWLIVGDNSAGKTSLVECLYLLVTGETTKKMPVDQMAFRYSKDKSWKVAGEIQIGSALYLIERGRSSGKPFLHVQMTTPGGETLLLDKASIGETQKHIYMLLGLEAEDILALAYFSARNEVTFTDAKQGLRNSLLGRLVGTEHVEALQATLSDFVSKWQTNVTEIGGQITALRTQRDEKNRKIALIQSQPDDDVEKKAAAREKALYTELISLIPSAKLDKALRELPLAMVRERLDTRRKELNAEIDDTLEADLRHSRRELDQITLQIRSKEQEIETINQKLKALDRQREAAKKTKTCPTCGQTVKGNQLASHFEKEEAQLLQNAGALGGQLDDLQQKKPGLEKSVSDLEKKCGAFESVRSVGIKLDALSSSISSFLIAKKPTPKDSQLQHLMADVKELEAKIEKLEPEHKSLSGAVEIGNWIIRRVLGKSGLLVAELNKLAMDLLTREMNEIVGDPKLYRASPVYGTDPDIVVSFKGEAPETHTGMGGGQKRLTDILVMLAMNNLMSRRYGLKHGVLGLLIFDEVFLYMAEEFSDIAHLALSKSVAPLRLLISHDTRLQSFFSQRIVVTRKPNSPSQYEVRN